jgi:hypothetical protein
MKVAVLVRRRLYGSTAGAVVTFDPTTLFTGTDTGWVYDLSDMSTLFQDAAGTTPVTAVGQPVGLELDKSKGAGYSGGVFTGLASEQVINGDFQTDVSGWSQNSLGTLTWVAGRARIVSTGTTSAYQAFSVIAGKTYVVSGSLEVTQHPGSNENAVVSIRSGTGATTTELLRVATVSGGTGTDSATVLYVAATTATVYIHLRLFGALTAEFDNISVKELPGNHRTQSTALNRPTYARHPLGGIRNLLTRTEEFDNAVWQTTVTNMTFSANQAVAPDGTTTADQITATAANGTFQRNVTVSASVLSYAYSIYVKKVGSGAVFRADLRDATTNYAYTFNLDTLAVTALATAATSATITDVGGGWFRVAIVGTNVVASSAMSVHSYIPTSGNSFFIWGAQLELGSTATAYQRVGANAFDVTEAGVEDLYYLSYDGINDSLATASFAWGTDKATVVAGVRVIGSSAGGFIVETSTDIAANNGAFHLIVPNTSPFGGRAFRSKGSTIVDAITASDAYTAPVTQVLTGLGDVSGDTARLRVNGTQVGQSTGDQGTGNYGSYPAYFGARAGTSVFFNGREYSNVGINRLLTTDELAALESWTAGKTGLNWANIISPTVFARDDTAVLDRFNQTIERRAS